MNIVIRSDASSSIGYGHIVRCLTIAQELRNHNARVSFICRRDEGNLIDFVRGNGFEVFELSNCVGLTEDGVMTEELIKGPAGFPDYLVLDHYGLDCAWETHIRPHVGKIMVIDDYENREHDCDIFLNQNYGARREVYDALLPRKSRRLCGSEYALVRKQFRQARKGLHFRDGTVKKIFIFMGSVDHTNETKKAIVAIDLLHRPSVSSTVILGETNPHREDLLKLYKDQKIVEFFRQVYNVAPFMMNADLAVCAGGSSVWEMCCLGLPSVVLILAENQKRLVESLAGDGIVISAGHHTEIGVEKLSTIIDEVISDSEALREMSSRSMKVVDGEGVVRVVNEML